MATEKKTNIKKFYQQSAKPSNYVPNALVTSSPSYPPTMSGLMQINPETKDIWISAGREFVSDWINIVGGGGGGGNVAVQYNSNPISAAATTLNFIGTNLTVDGDPLVNITIPQVPYIIKDTNPGTDVKNTLTPSQTYSAIIPGKTVKAGSIIRVTYRVIKGVNPLGPTDIDIKIGPVNNYSIYSSVAFGRINYSISNPYRFGQITRHFIYDGVLTKAIDNKNPNFTDDTEALDKVDASIDWSVTQYMMFGIQHLSSVTDSGQGVFYCIEIF
jgi:hypothetical protein